MVSELLTLPSTEGKSGRSLVEELLKHRPEQPVVNNEVGGIYWEVEDFDRMFINSSSKVILNDMPYQSSEDQKAIQKKVFKITSGNSLESYPSCECGHTKYVENLTAYTGKNCPKCALPVVYQHEKELEPVLWLGVPDGVDAFISPVFWYQIESATRSKTHKVTHNSFSPLRWFTNPYYRNYSGGRKLVDYLEQLLEDGEIVRDYNWTIRNFDKVLDIIGDCLATHAPGKVAEFLKVKMVIQMYKDKVFTKYLPLPNSLCVVFEQQDFSYRRMTGSASLLMPAINHLLGLKRTPPDSGVTPEPLTKAQQKKVCKEVATFSVDYQVYWDYVIREEIGRKPGIARKDTFGVRPPFTYRAVITSITGPHDYDELHLPWSVACELFRPFIHEELLNEGMGPVQIESFINRHMRIYHERLELLFNKVIGEWRSLGFKGWPSSLIRNPSLYVASNQTQFITKVKTDPKDKTLSLSWICCYGYNGD